MMIKLKNLSALMAVTAAVSVMGSSVSALAQDKTLQDPPSDFVEVPMQKVLVVAVEATKGQYAVRTGLDLGVPTEGIITDREVVIRALGRQGEPLYVVSVANPRLGWTTGTKDPERFELDEGAFRVAFPADQPIAVIELEVLDGPDRGLKLSVPAETTRLPTQPTTDFPDILRNGQ
ncbi:hypothetical protein [Parvularcula sp. LCG005]|uniref:hypothetical protein n=1 Tax=Parvularcula sp. LCG005 TaxID=3078805 RepID=UPI0029421BBF|nr:hypothetical protein [Parvularcula sp. LCG005]WOI53894.1 hypothetical protein RUI03_02565 [Parvularcula sp. LCG005]